MNPAHIIFYLHALRPLQYTMLQALNPSFACQVASVSTVSALSTSVFFVLLEEASATYDLFIYGYSGGGFSLSGRGGLSREMR